MAALRRIARSPEGFGRESEGGPHMETYEDIKLIACDMDGTLLDERSQVPPETFDLVRSLDAAGIRFVAASGRR